MSGIQREADLNLFLIYLLFTYHKIMNYIQLKTNNLILLTYLHVIKQITSVITTIQTIYINLCNLTLEATIEY